MNDRVLIIGLFSAGLGCAAVGLQQIDQTSTFVENAESTTALVTSLKEHIGQYDNIEPRHKAGKYSRVYYTTVMFNTQAGLPIVSQSGPHFAGRNRTITSNSVPTDKNVKVFYDPGNPNQFKLDTRWSLWGTSVIFFGIGFISLGLGIAVYMGVPITKHLVGASMAVTRRIGRGRGTAATYTSKP